MKPPSLDVIERQLRALGVDPAKMDNSDDKVHAAFVEHWKKYKRIPKLDEIRKTAGIDGTTLDSVVRRLVARGRLFRMAERGQYVPKVTE